MASSSMLERLPGFRTPDESLVTNVPSVDKATRKKLTTET